MIVLLQGPPGSGKTSVARAVSEKFGFFHISKDDIKETFFDVFRCDDTGFSSEIGKAANQLLFKVIGNVPDNKSHFLIESNFNPEIAKNELDRVLKNKNVDLVEVFLTASKETLLSRFKQRWKSGNRHSGHCDNERYNDLEEYLSHEPRPINFTENLIEINTEANLESVQSQLIEKLLPFLDDSKRSGQ